jgi:hypothetical protein
MGKDSSTWLTGLVMGAASTLATIPGLESIKLIEGAEASYEIFGAKGKKPLIDTGFFRLYVAKLPTGQIGFMKISVTADNNSALETEAELLQRMRDLANEIDAPLPAQGKFNYGAFFPMLVEQIDAGGRVALILGFDPSIGSYKQLNPIARALNGQRVDLKTGVWLLVKQLKVLDFIHRQMGIVLNRVSAGNLLIETAKHGVFYLDWSEASEGIEEDFRDEVSSAAKIVWEVCGGADSSEPPHDEDLMTRDQHYDYVALLRRMIDEPKTALEEYDALYELSDSIWPKVPNADGTGMKRQFHEWVTYTK